MERRPTRWHRMPSAHRRSQRGGRSARSGNVVVLLIIVGCVLVIGLNAPSIRFESLLALFGFR